MSTRWIIEPIQAINNYLYIVHCRKLNSLNDYWRQFCLGVERAAHIVAGAGSYK